MSMEWIRRNYGVPAKRGGRVRFFGVEGTITSASQYLRVRMDDGRRILLHPTWEVDFLELHCIGDGLRRMYLESDYESVEEFLASLKCPDRMTAPHSLPDYKPEES